MISSVPPPQMMEERPDEGGFTFDFWGVILRRKWILVLGMIVGLAASYLYYTQATPKYESVARVLVTHKGNPSLYDTVSRLLSEDQLSSPMSKVLPTHQALVRSPLIVSRAVEQERLARLRTFASFSSPEISSTIMQGMEVTVGTEDAPDADVLDVAYKGLDPQDTQKIVNAVVGTYQDFLGETYKNVSQDAADLIRTAKDELHKQLSAKEAEYRKFRSQYPLVAGEDSPRLHLAPLQAIEQERSKSLVQQVVLETRVESLKKAIEQNVSRDVLVLMVQKLSRSVMESSALSQTKADWKTQLLPLMVQKEIMLQKYGKEHPRVREIETQLQILTEYHTKRTEEDGGNELTFDISSKADFLEVYLQSLNQELYETRQREKNLSQIFEQKRESAKTVEMLQLRDQAYQNEIERMKQMFETVLARLQEIDLMSGKDYGGYKVTVLAHAGPGRQVEPKLAIVLSVGGIAGLGIGFALGFLIDLADKSFRSPDEIRDQLGMPVVAHIPVLPADQVIPESADKSIHPSILAYHKSNSREAEAYRRVRTALYFSTHGEAHKVIQVTSPDASDGKTTLCGNLAACIAQSGKRILLVDADLRRPRLHRLYKVDTSAGLATYLRNEAELTRCIYTTELENLYVMPCGPKPSNPAELLVSKRFGDVIQELREKFDFVIVDSPPLLAVSDAAVVAAHVDGVLMTMRISKKVRPNALRAVEQLHSVNAHVIGAIVNGVGPHPGYGNYGYGKYAYNYYYYQYSRNYNYRDAYGYGDYNSYYHEADERSPTADAHPQVPHRPSGNGS